MKLVVFLAKADLTLDLAASQIGGVSVSGLRKWLAHERVPRPDQMRRIFEWSNGAVTPNDFVLADVGHLRLGVDVADKHGPASFDDHEKPTPRLSQRGAS